MIATTARRRASAATRFRRRPTTMVFLALLAAIVVLVIVGPAFAADPVATDFAVLQPPDGMHIMGTDQLGRDYFARVVVGGRVSLLVGGAVTVVCLTFALIVGGIAGFSGGLADTVLVKVSEFFQVIPGVILALVAAALLGSNVWIVVTILSLTMWPNVARIVRAESMRISQLGFVESARAAGFRSPRILWSDVIPNALPPVLVATTMTAGRAVLLESGLAYLGIGDANHPSWGSLLNAAQPHMSTAWWLALFPGALICLVVLAVNMLGDALNDALNPTIGRVK